MNQNYNITPETRTPDDPGTTASVTPRIVGGLEFHESLTSNLDNFNNNAHGFGENDYWNPEPAVLAVS